MNTILDYLKVFNNINKRPAYEPRTMAQGGRIGFSDGTPTLVGQGPRKGLYHLRLGTNVHERETTWDTLANQKKRLKKHRADVKKVASVKKDRYLRLETAPKPKGFLTKKQFLKFLVDNNIKSNNPGSFAATHGINTKINPLQKNTLLYDTSQFNDEFIETIQKKQIRTGQATDFAKKKFPPKTKHELHKPRYKTIVKHGGIKKHSPFTGTLDTHLGHGMNIWADKITGDTLVYTPKEINLAMSKKGGLDHKIRKVSEKIEAIKKQNIPAAEKKALLEALDTTLIRMASQSQGFKKVKLSSGKFFGEDKLTIDMFDEFPGKTEVEINEFVKKWKDKKTWNTAEEFNNIKKAKLFEINRKNQLKTASKIGKKEQNKIITEVKRKFTKLGCGMYAGGRVGFAVGSGTCINRAMAKLKSGNLTTVEKKLMNGLGDDLTRIAGKGGMPKKFWTTALKGEGYFALADFANNLTKGQSLDKSFSNAIETATFGLLDLGGNERDLMKYAKERGLDTEAMEEWMDYAQTYGKYVDTSKDLEAAKAAVAGEDTMFVGEYDDMLVESRTEELPGKIKNLEKQLEEKAKSETIQSGKGYKDLNEMIEGVVAKEWNKPAGTVLDRGLRKMLGMKGDEGLVWGPIGTSFREGIETLGFGEQDSLKGFTPQTVMNYHPAYGYKEDIKDVIRGGDSPMEDMLMFMEKNYPSSALVNEALRTKEEDLKEKEQWVDTGFGRKKKIVNKDMGTYDYNPNLAEGGIASLNVKK